jgi:hypothetical protein
MSSGAIALLGAGGGVPVVMTVGAATIKDGRRFGFNSDNSRQAADTIEDQVIGILSPNTITIGGVDYEVDELFQINDQFQFRINTENKAALSTTSVTSVTTELGTVSLSGATFIAADDYVKWYLAATNIFGTTEGATLIITYGF